MEQRIKQKSTLVWNKQWWVHVRYAVDLEVNLEHSNVKLVNVDRVRAVDVNFLELVVTNRVNDRPPVRDGVPIVGVVLMLTGCEQPMKREQISVSMHTHMFYL